MSLLPRPSPQPRRARRAKRGPLQIDLPDVGRRAPWRNSGPRNAPARTCGRSRGALPSRPAPRITPGWAPGRKTPAAAAPAKSPPRGRPVAPARKRTSAPGMNRSRSVTASSFSASAGHSPRQHLQHRESSRTARAPRRTRIRSPGAPSPAPACRTRSATRSRTIAALPIGLGIHFRRRAHVQVLHPFPASSGSGSLGPVAAAARAAATP